ncbi:hypothetical protein CAPTEDRAFT_195221 [Capitella teleta]|uniref:Reverse transcriptase domain-containing protein n=1 Tax=Capitella teleta TaxID=283909 RepID=R7UVQ5_CAPTE|nr:hypothetical protein CAPTEDRAFT_195221 [Capitella teleta]|eukprot:ELU10409.1 hypothetical protein CAPTEDRAFT_195221 [Capitella teleta]
MSFISREIAEEQFGFVKGKVTQDTIVALRNIIEMTVSKQDKELWLMFIDYSKAAAEPLQRRSRSDESRNGQNNTIQVRLRSQPWQERQPPRSTRTSATKINKNWNATEPSISLKKKLAKSLIWLPWISTSVKCMSGWTRKKRLEESINLKSEIKEEHKDTADYSAVKDEEEESNSHSALWKDEFKFDANSDLRDESSTPCDEVKAEINCKENEEYLSSSHVDGTETENEKSFCKISSVRPRGRTEIPNAVKGQICRMKKENPKLRCGENR